MSVSWLLKRFRANFGADPGQRVDQKDKLCPSCLAKSEVCTVISARLVFYIAQLCACDQVELISFRNLLKCIIYYDLLKGENAISGLFHHSCSSTVIA